MTGVGGPRGRGKVWTPPPPQRLGYSQASGTEQLILGDRLSRIRKERRSKPCSVRPGPASRPSSPCGGGRLLGRSFEVLGGVSLPWREGQVE